MWKLYTSSLLFFLAINKQVFCGDEVQLRVLSGEVNDAKSDEFPWNVPLKLIGNPHNIDSCSGSIIGVQWVVTTAGCLDGTKKVEIYPGTINRNKSNIVMISNEFIIHEKYNKENYAYDIGLIKLKTKLCFGEFITPITVSSDPVEISAIITLPAWPEKGSMLKYLDHAIVPLEQCEKFYSTNIEDPQFCTASGPDHKNCYGTIGSGAIIYRSSQPSLVGINIYHSSSCDDDGPLGYADVTRLSDWIRAKTENV